MKYIDLEPQIVSQIPGSDADQRRVLRWLDDHPDQLPGRTITESRFKTIRDEFMRRNIVRSASGFFELVTFGLGLTVIPDPESTEAAKLADYLTVFDLDVITNQGRLQFAQALAMDGVKAPEAGGDDEH